MSPLWPKLVGGHSADWKMAWLGKVVLVMGMHLQIKSHNKQLDQVSKKILVEFSLNRKDQKIEMKKHWIGWGPGELKRGV